VKLCDINCSGPVVFETHCRHVCWSWRWKIYGVIRSWKYTHNITITVNAAKKFELNKTALSSNDAFHCLW